MASSKPATDTIIKQQEDILNSLPFDNKQDFDDALKGFVGRLEPNVITNANGDIIWDNDSYKFLENERPDTANPSLWRQSRLNSVNGLFKVVDGIYQVRGLDLSNTTIIEGDTGIIVIDTLTSQETAAAALSLYKTHRGDKNVKGVIYTHSHVDHFGGVRGFVSEDDIDKGVKIYAPEGFLEHAVSENVYTGVSMARRAAYMYGAALNRDAQSQIGAGLGQTVSTGTVTLLAPTDIVYNTKDTATIDGVKLVFQMAPDTEAPSEMLIYLPGFKALCAAEDATHTFHNLLTLRGAVVRDARGWGRYLTETIDLFGADLEVVFASHHWPVWGNERAVSFLAAQRDTYAYVHDQTLRLLNKGFNGTEIAEQMTLPPALDQTWSSRGYYGSLSHNVKAIYQRYVGWFDGNPSNLWQHVPVEQSKRYVDLVGGIGQMLSKAQEAFGKGDFRWAAELANHAVFVEPENTNVLQLLADIYEQLGYGAENGTWRDFFISGAVELRGDNFGTPTQTSSADVIAQLTPEMLFDSLAIQLNGPEAWDEKLSIDVWLTDADVTYRLWLSNGALIYNTHGRPTAADVILSATTKSLPAMLVYGLDPDALEKAGIKVTDGDKTVLTRLAALIDPGDPNFNIVKP